MKHPAFNIDNVSDAEATIRAYRARYYDGDPTIEDSVFDALLAHFRTTFPDSKVWDEIGATPAGTKVKHIIPMTSLDNAIGEDAFRKWHASRQVGSAWLCVEPKLDGLSIELVYRAGNLVEATTRGDGVEGESVFHTMKDVVPNKIAAQGQLIVRGEVMILNSVFEAELAGTMRNARNAAAGITRRSDSSQNHLLTFFAFHVMGDATATLTSQTEKLALLDELGFEIPFHHHVCCLDEVLAVYNTMGALRSALPGSTKGATNVHECVRPNYEYDGLVVKIDDNGEARRTADLYDRTEFDNPVYQVAFKWAEVAKTSTIKDVDLEVGRTGAITPVAILEDVDIGGVTVRRASLCNWDEVKRLGIHIGSRVKVVRSGEVVPKVVGLAEGGQPMANRPIREPDACPVCAGGVERDGPRLLCINPTCPAKAGRMFLNWFQKNKILGWGPEVCAGLVDEGYTTIADVYGGTCLQIDLAAITGSEKTAAKLVDTLEKSKAITLDMLVGCFGIDGLGRSEAAHLIEHFGVSTLDDLLNPVLESNGGVLLDVPGYKERKASKVFMGLAKAADKLRVLATYLDIEKPVEVNADGSLAGKSFCFSQVRLSPDDEVYLASCGGITKSGVSKGLDYLVVKDPSKKTSKVKKAEGLGVPVLTIEQFRELLSQA